MQVNLVHLDLSQRPFMTSVDDPIALRSSLLFRMLKLVKESHLLHQISANGSDQVVKVVGREIEIVWQPKADVVDALGIGGNGTVDNLLAWIVGDKLIEKAGVFAPKEADIGYLVEAHGKSLQAQAKGPANLKRDNLVTS